MGTIIIYSKRWLISRKNTVTVHCNLEHTNALDTTKMLHHMCRQLTEIQNRKHLIVIHVNKHNTLMRNRPFCRCVLSCLAFEWKRGWSSR